MKSRKLTLDTSVERGRHVNREESEKENRPFGSLFNVLANHESGGDIPEGRWFRSCHSCRD